MNMTYDLIQHIEKQKEFSVATFGPGNRLDGVLDHIQKEIEEIKKEPQDLYEWIDLILLSIDGAWRNTGASPEEIAYALMAKLEKNMKRKWPDWRTFPEGKAIEHID